MRRKLKRSVNGAVTRRQARGIHSRERRTGNNGRKNQDC